MSNAAERSALGGRGGSAAGRGQGRRRALLVLTGVCADGEDPVDNEQLRSRSGNGDFWNHPCAGRRGGRPVREWRGGSSWKNGAHLLPRTAGSKLDRGASEWGAVMGGGDGESSVWSPPPSQ